MLATTTMQANPLTLNSATAPITSHNNAGKTAKKYGVVAYDAEQLWQGANDATVVTLLKTEHAATTVRLLPSRAAAQHNAKKGTSFRQGTLSHTNPPCYTCSKTVYPMEFVGASNKAFHKRCFRCDTCDTMLKPNDYCVSLDGKFRCAPHHRDAELQGMPQQSAAVHTVAC
jgi:hypothetical protein